MPVIVWQKLVVETDAEVSNDFDNEEKSATSSKRTYFRTGYRFEFEFQRIIASKKLIGRAPSDFS